MPRTASQWLVTAVLLPLLSGCGAELTSGGRLSGSAKATESTDTQGDPAHSKSSVPLPPPSGVLGQGGGELLKTNTAYGLKSCVAERRDLSRVFVRWSVRAALAPVERLILREWIISAASFPADASIEACDDALLCLWLPRKDINANIEDLARTLVGAPSQAFFSQHLKTSALAEELRETTPTWRLYTQAVALLNQASAPNAYGSESAEDAWIRIIRDAGGKKAVSTTSLATMRQGASLAVAESDVLIAGPGSPRGMEAALLSGLKNSKGQPNAPATQSSAGSPFVERPTILRIPHETEISSGLLLWKPAPGTAATLEFSLRLLAQRWKNKEQKPASVRFSPAQGLYPWPYLLVEGAYEDVETTISELLEWSGELASDRSPAQVVELDAAEVFQLRSSLEPRCSAPRRRSTRTTSHLIRDALHAAGQPAVLLMGRAEAPLTVED